MSCDREPSPPSRHEKWMRAPLRPNGDCTLNSSSLAVERIDLLVNSSREGTFIPEPQHDILVEAIRTKEHGGRVRGVGDGIDLRVFFGMSRKSIGQLKNETLEELQRNIDTQKQEFYEKLQVEWETRRK
ncbi:unnamed protein product [Lathyrus oleraceus]